MGLRASDESKDDYMLDSPKMCLNQRVGYMLRGHPFNNINIYIIPIVFSIMWSYNTEVLI